MITLTLFVVDTTKKRNGKDFCQIYLISTDGYRAVPNNALNSSLVPVNKKVVQRFEATEDGTTGLLGVDRGAISLMLDCPMSGHGREACVSLQVEDADAYYDEWRDRVEIRHPPKDQPWGARTFDLIDPFGNTIFVMGPVT